MQTKQKPVNIVLIETIPKIRKNGLCYNVSANVMPILRLG